MSYTNAFTEWTKAFTDSSLTNPTQAYDRLRRAGEFASEVIQLTAANTQEIVRRQTEILRSNAEQAIKATKEIAGNTNPENAAAKQADFAKNLLEYNVNSVRELVELSTKSAQEVFEVVNKHISEQVKEFSEAAAPAAAKKKAA